MADYELDLSELDDASEADLSEKAAPKRPSSQSSYKPRPTAGTPQAVTQAQLEAALSRVDGKIKTVADGVSTISSRVNSLTTAAKKEAEMRKKATDNTSKDLNSKLQMLALLPLLVQPGTATLSGTFSTPGGGTVTNPNIALADPNSTLDSLLPLLLVSGMGTGTGSSGGFGFGDGSDGGVLLLALALAFAGPKS